MNLSKYNYIIHADNKPHIVFVKENTKRGFPAIWICKSSTHVAYGATPEEAYAVWKSIGEGRFNAAAYNNGWTEETIRMRLSCFEINSTI
jgi:hypothetical protein